MIWFSTATYATITVSELNRLSLSRSGYIASDCKSTASSTRWWIMMEFCQHGSLYEYLSNAKYTPLQLLEVNVIFCSGFPESPTLLLFLLFAHFSPTSPAFGLFSATSPTF